MVVTEDTGKFLLEALKGPTSGGLSSDETFHQLAGEIILDARERKQIIPGLDHPVHKQGDPRTPRLFQIAEESGTNKAHLLLFEAMGRVSEETLGKSCRSMALVSAGRHWQT